MTIMMCTYSSTHIIYIFIYMYIHIVAHQLTSCFVHLNALHVGLRRVPRPGTTGQHVGVSFLRLFVYADFIVIVLLC